MADKYFVIQGDEDGGCRIEEMTKEQLLKAMTPNQYGERQVYGEILSCLPEDICNFSDVVIIKGEIVVPRPKKTVVEYDL